MRFPLLYFYCVAMLSLMSVSCASLIAPVPVDQVREQNQPDSTLVVEDSTAEESLSGGTVAEESAYLPSYGTRSGTRVHGYYAWWTRGLWLDLDLSLYDKLFFFDLTPASDGSLLARNGYPFAWQGLIQRADSFQVPVIPTLALLNADSLEALFLDPDHRLHLLESSLTLIEESGGEGLHLDFEWFAPAEDTLREGFHSYVDTLVASVEDLYPDAELSMFVPAFHPEGMIDLARIPDAFSEIMVQGYDLHWQTGPHAGPLAPLQGWKDNNWQTILASMDERGLDRQRLFLTVPYYGYEWPVSSPEMGAQSRGTARVTTFARLDTLNLPEMQLASSDRAAQYGLKRDSTSRSPYYVFEDSTGWNQGWFEDAVSLDQKYDFVSREGLAGVAIFPIGYDDSLLDALLIEQFGIRQLPADSTAR